MPGCRESVVDRKHLAAAGHQAPRCMNCREWGWLMSGLEFPAFRSAAVVRAPIPGWLTDYNTARPHSALGYLPPSVYRAQCEEKAKVSPSLSPSVSRIGGHSTNRMLRMGRCLRDVRYPNPCPTDTAHPSHPGACQ